MKKLKHILAIFLVILTICGCTARGDLPEEQPMESTASVSSLESEQEKNQQPIPKQEQSSEQETEAEEDAQLPVGKYIFHAEGVDEVYCPNLVLREDGTCRFNVNLLTNMGTINGTYTMEDDVLLTLQADKLSFEGFLGDDTKRVYFEVVSEDALMYRGTDAGDDAVIGMTNPMDLFKKES